MSVFLWNAKITYVSVPKIACTSLKHMFFQVENGRPFENFISNGKHWYVHNLYPSRPFANLPRERIADHDRFALVRDPLRRFLSCYSNRVIHHRELSEQKAGRVLAARGLMAQPDLSTFIDRLDDYCAAVESIRHHSLPMVQFLGRDPGWYTGLYRIEAMGEFLAALSARLGRPLEAPRLQTDGPKIETSALTAAQRSVLMRRYEEDYAIFGGWL